MMKKYISSTTSHTIKTCGCNCGHHLHGYQGKRKTSKTDELVIFVAKEIVTMNSSWPSCTSPSHFSFSSPSLYLSHQYTSDIYVGTAVAIQQSRIVGVGDLKCLLSVWNKSTFEVRIDRTFEDLCIVPGFIDPHIHPLIGGTAMSLPCVAYHDTPNPFGPDYAGCSSKKDVIKRLQAAVKKKIKSETREPKSKEELVKSCILAWGWDSVAMGGHLDRRDLDQVSKIRPVVVWDCSMHLAYLNTCALHALDLNKNKSKISKTEGVMLDSRTGELNGQFLGLRAMPHVAPFFREVLRADRCMKSMHYLTELARQGGITTMGEMLLGTFNLAMEEAVFDIFFNDENVTPMRCVVIVDANKAVASAWGSTSAAVRSIREKQKNVSFFVCFLYSLSLSHTYMQQQQQQQQSTEHLIFNNGVKFITDDAFLGLTMQMGYPGYVDGHEGIWNNEPGPTYVDKMLPFWKGGCRYVFFVVFVVSYHTYTHTHIYIYHN